MPPKILEKLGTFIKHSEISQKPSSNQNMKTERQQN